MRNTQRNEKNEMIYNLLSSEELVGILKQDFNKFKIVYKHPTKISMDVCIVILIDEFKKISMITNFTKNKNLRVKSW